MKRAIVLLLFTVVFSSCLPLIEPATMSDQSGNLDISKSITLPAGATVDGVDISTLGGASHAQGTDTTQGIQAADLNMGFHDITNVGNVDGVDVSVIGMAAHTQGTDQGLDTGGPNAVTVAAVKSAVNDSHAKQHSITSTLDHTSTATPGQMLKADANGLPVNATNTDAQVSGAVSASHTQNTDTSLGAQSAALNMNTHPINNVTDPTNAQDAVTITYYNAHMAAFSDNTTGTGTANTLVKWTGASTQNNSLITDNGTYTVIGDNLNVTGSIAPTENITMVSGKTVDGVDVSNLPTIGIEFIIDGGGVAIASGVKGDLEIPSACTITKATALADQNGTLVVSIWKDTYANFPPLVGDNITAGAPITIVAGNAKIQDAVLTGWNKTINSGDILRYNVDSCTSITRVTISLTATRN